MYRYSCLLILFLTVAHPTAFAADKTYTGTTITGPSFDNKGRPYNGSGSWTTMSDGTETSLNEGADAWCKANHPCPEGEEGYCSNNPFSGTGDNAKHDTVKDGYKKGQAKAYATRDITCACKKKTATSNTMADPAYNSFYSLD